MAASFYLGLPFVLLAIWYTKSRDTRRRQPLPPGPKPHFLLGNATDFPKEAPWLTFEEWKKQYGDLVYINILGKSMLILNSQKSCVDLLDKRSAKYSDRPRLVMLNELMGMDFSLPLMGYSARWRAHRRMFHQYFNDRVVKDYRHTQECHAHTLLRRLLQSPEKFGDHTRLAFTANITDVVYDLKVDSHDHIYVKVAEEAVHLGSIAAAPGAFLVDLFPILKHVPAWLPGAGFKKKAAMWRVPVVGMKMMPYDHVKRNLRDGIAAPSIMASMLTRCEEEKTVIEEGVTLDESLEEIARNTAAVAYGAGSDTTLSSIMAFYFAMALYPEVQKMAQTELDSVVGTDRLPSFDDSSQLPYVSAVLMETLRWHNVTPLGIPHMTTEDDEYEGYFIPKGTLVMANVWSILHDPEQYPNPHVFDPSRWIRESDGGKKVFFDADIAAFGFGRRICPGRHFANDSLFIIIATILASFNISPPMDAAGKTEQLKWGVTSGVFSYPTSYMVNFKPRSAEITQLVKDTELL